MTVPRSLIVGFQPQPPGGSCLIPRHHLFLAGLSRPHDIRSHRRRVMTEDRSRMVEGSSTTPMPHRYHRLHTVCRGKTTGGTLAEMPDINVYSTPHSMIPSNSVDLHRTPRHLRSSASCVARLPRTGHRRKKQTGNASDGGGAKGVRGAARIRVAATTTPTPAVVGAAAVKGVRACVIGSAAAGKATRALRRI